jgi:hypothetical protein
MNEDRTVVSAKADSESTNRRIRVAKTLYQMGVSINMILLGLIKSNISSLYAITDDISSVFFTQPHNLIPSSVTFWWNGLVMLLFQSFFVKRIALMH